MVRSRPTAVQFAEGDEADRAANREARAEALADVLGISVEDLMAAREAGQTPAEIAEENGVSRDELVSSLVAERQASLDQAVADGELTQEEADEKAADLEEHVNAFVDGEGHGPHGPGGPDREARAEALADVLGISVEDLMAAREAGQTPAEIAEENGVSRDELVSSLVAERQASLDQAVADGELTQEEADEKAADLEEHVNAFVDGEGHGPHGPGGPDGDAPDAADEEVDA